MRIKPTWSILSIILSKMPLFNIKTSAISNLKAKRESTSLLKRIAIINPNSGKIILKMRICTWM
jgi:hypothetical protein